MCMGTTSLAFWKYLLRTRRPIINHGQHRDLINNLPGVVLHHKEKKREEIE